MDTNIVVETVCFGCRHLRKYPTCDAFPDGIPEIVRRGASDHKEALEGDGGLRFLPYTDPAKAQP